MDLITHRSTDNCGFELSQPQATSVVTSHNLKSEQFPKTKGPADERKSVYTPGALPEKEAPLPWPALSAGPAVRAPQLKTGRCKKPLPITVTGGKGEA